MATRFVTHDHRLFDAVETIYEMEDGVITQTQTTSENSK